MDKQQTTHRTAAAAGHAASPTPSLNYEPVMPERKDWRIGCIGSGFIMADCHLVAYRQVGFNPVAIASRHRENAARVAERHGIVRVHDSVEALLADETVEVLDVAIPPDLQRDVIERALRQQHIRAILAQKPMGVDYRQAAEIVRMCADAGVTLAVNQNMRYDQSVRACKSLLDQQVLGTPVLGTIDMRAIPHWMPWQERQGWATLRIMSIHHLDTFRFWFGDPARIFCSTRPDPRTKFPHEDGICLYILEWDNGLRASSWDDVYAGPAREGAAADIAIRWRVEGTEGMARGTIGWPSYPQREPSTLDYTTTRLGAWVQPRWDKVWFPDAFAGTMAQLLVALERNTEPEISGREHLRTMALVDAGYLSAKEHRAVTPAEIAGP
jgi:predicted dehydrogenase